MKIVLNSHTTKSYLTSLEQRLLVLKYFAVELVRLFFRPLSSSNAISDYSNQLFYSQIGDDTVGYFVQPTVLVTSDPKSLTMVEEIFGPVITTFVYEDTEFNQTCALIDGTTEYGLTGCLFVSRSSYR
jgi:hypothetical protein